MDKTYLPNDWLLIANGHTVLAFAKVINAPQSSSNFPKYREEFKKLQIPFDEKLIIAEAQWIELENKDRFKYKLQQGIRIVQSPETIYKFNHLLAKYTNTMFQESILNLLKSKKQIILQGPPGTGKTRLAKKLGQALVAENSIGPNSMAIPDFIDVTISEDDIKSIVHKEDVVNSPHGRKEYLIEENDSLNKKVIVRRESNTKDSTSYNDIISAAKNQLWQQKLNQNNHRRAAALAKHILEAKNYNQQKSMQKSDCYEIIQFHPSYTYEDFVRGISVKNNQNGDIIYKTENKVFAKYAERALGNYLNYNKENTTYSKEKKLDEYFNLFVEKIIDDIENNAGFLKLTENVGLVSIEEDAFRYKGNAEGWIKNGNRMLFKDIKRAYLDENLERQDLKKNPNLSGLAKQHASYFVRVLKIFYDFIADNNFGFDDEVLESEPLNNYVLIIDEINRANLSSVLGELIYALEYRGEPVKSMYDIDGNNTITIPPNLYIIGTMNTADRSVGVMDYAVRRRFAFVDVLPKIIDESSLKGKKFKLDTFQKVSTLFVTNNIQEESDGVLNHSEHLSDEFRPEYVWLGHSYFIYEDDNFESQLKYEIIPILKEYVKDGILKESALKVIDTLY